MVILEASHPSSMDQATRHLAGGGLLIFPTETFYGLGTDPRNPAAVELLLAIKGRPAGQPLPLLAGAEEQVQAVAPGWDWDDRILRLSRRFWPGPLTLILEGGPGLAEGVRAPDGTVAVRVSSHPTARCLALSLGFPLVATSANRAGAPPSRTAQEALVPFLTCPEVWVLDGGPVPGESPSTIVDGRGGSLRIVRPGTLDRAEILAAWVS